MLSKKQIILPKFLIKDHIEFEILYEKFGFAKICNNIKEVIKYINSYSENSSDQNLESIEKFYSGFCLWW